MGIRDFLFIFRKMRVWELKGHWVKGLGGEYGFDKILYQKIFKVLRRKYLFNGMYICVKRC